MNRSTIIEKLRKFLQNHPKFKEEYEVIYLMVEIRKILDQEKILNETIRFYCNCVLHIKLTNKMTTQFISNMFEQDIDCDKNAHEIATKIKSNHSDFFKFSNLKLEFNNFFKNHNLPQNLLNKNWIIFTKLLLEIIKECPINCDSNKIRGLEIIQYDNRDYGFKFNLINNRSKPVIKLKFKQRKIIKN